MTVELLGRQADRKSSEKQEVDPLPGVHSRTLPKPTITSMLTMPINSLLFTSMEIEKGSSRNLLLGEGRNGSYFSL